MHRLDPQIMDRMLLELLHQDWAVARGLLADSLCQELRSRALALHKSGGLRPAAMGPRGQQTLRRELRGDSIAWIEASSPERSEQDLLSAVGELTTALRSHFFVALNAFEAHFACYEAGQGYARHLDCFRDQPGREFSLVLFLNPDWREEDAGELLIYNARSPHELLAQIRPELGTLVLFRSALVPHEVRAPLCPRYSIAGWLKSLDWAQAALEGSLLNAF